VDHLTFWLDVKIFFKTIFKVVKREGISEEGHVTRESFNGKN
jgi:lipopolysaccharide/colanic/teichoic acid biosynthesis glycosyltransferase